MIAARLIGAVFVVAVFVYPASLSADTCVTLSTAERLKLYPFVFEGTVMSARKLGPGQVLKVTTKRTWKGDIGAERILLHAISISGFALEAGRTYLIFGEELHPHDIFWRNRNDLQLTGKEVSVGSGCGGIIPIERADPILNELGPALSSR